MLGNKIDLINDLEVSQEEATELAEKNNIKYVQTSAKDATNLDMAFKMLLTNIMTNKNLEKKIDYRHNAPHGTKRILSKKSSFCCSCFD